MCAILKPKYVCPICGYLLDFPPEDFNICPSCGVEFGYENTGRTYLELRQEWLNTGARWASKVIPKPKKWDAMEQLQNLSTTVVPVLQSAYAIASFDWSMNPLVVKTWGKHAHAAHLRPL